MCAILTFAGVQTAAAEPLAVQVIAAQVELQQGPGGQPIVAFQMSEASAQAFAQLASDNIGRRIELRVDGKSIMKPLVREPIKTDVVQFPIAISRDEAKTLAARMAGGDAKVELELVPE